MLQRAPTDAGVPSDISAVEDQLRRLGFAANPAGMFTVQPGPMPAGTPDPQSAVAAILAQQNAAFRNVADAAAVPTAPPAPPPEVIPEPETNAANVEGGEASTNLNPLWAIPAAVVAAGLARLMGAKGITRGGKAAKAAKGATSSAAAAANAARGKVGMRGPGHTYGPHQPQNYPRPMQGPNRPPVQGPPDPNFPETWLERQNRVRSESRLGPNQPANFPPTPEGTIVPSNGALPPATLTQVEETPAVAQALVEQARGNIRGPVSNRPLPAPPLPRPVQPAYTAPLDVANDLTGSEVVKALTTGSRIAGSRAKSAAKTERLNTKRPVPAQTLTPDRRVPVEEGETRAFNEVVEAIRDAKSPKKAEKDLKPWLKEPKKDIGKPVLPRKKPGPLAKPKYKEVPETDTGKQLGENKVVTARASKRATRSLSEQGKQAPPTQLSGSENKYSKFTGKSGPSSAAKEPAVLRSFDRNDQHEVVEIAKLRHAKGKGWKGPMDADFVKIYGDTPKSRALYDAAQDHHRELAIVSRKRRQIKGK